MNRSFRMRFRPVVRWANGRVWCCAALLAMIASAGAGTVSARQDGVLPINDPIQLFLERQQTAGRIHAPVLSQLPLSGYEARALLDSVALRADELTGVDARRLARFRGELEYPGALGVWMRWNALYANGRDWVSAESPDWAIQVNPIVILGYGQGVRSAGKGPDDTPSVMQNTRGFRVSGQIHSLVYFEGRFTEGQERVVRPQAQAGTAPRHGMVKLVGLNTYDGFGTTGIVGLKSRFIEVRAGRDRARWGPAMSSVSLSNYAAPYDQVMVRAHFWRLSYTSLFAGFSSTRAEGASPEDAIRRRKYGSMHRLDVALPGRIQLGVFESVIFATDSQEVRERFDWSYANPMIFLRAAERDRGSPDNAMLGASAAWVPISGLRLYGEMLLDEFNSSELGNQWWGNKFAWVVGAHVADLPLARLSARAEITRVRPFTYSHNDEINAFVHFGDPLGFAGGSNAMDYSLFLDWQPGDRVSASLASIYTRQGRNGNGVNYGSDPILSNETRAGNHGQAMLQGIRANRLLVEGQIGYELLPYLVLEAAVRLDSIDDEETGLDRYVTPFVQLRWGLPFPWTRY